MRALNSMNSRWAAIVTATLLAFASLVIAWQFRHYNDTSVENWFSSLGHTYVRGKQLSVISDIVERDRQITPAAAGVRQIDLMYPKDARIFMMDMIGPTNYDKIGYYFWATYYLFPREVGTSLDHVTRQTKDGFVGTTSDSIQEILSNGYDVRMMVLDRNTSGFQPIRNMSIGQPANPDWFGSKHDLVVAFLLPLLTAFAGIWLLRFFFSTLDGRMPFFEQLACGLGLGMMAVAALTLGVKLCGFHGCGLILVVTALGATAEIWRDCGVILTKITDSSRTLFRNPTTAVCMIIGLLVFAILFHIAGLQGLTDPDAMRWMLKAKMIHLYTGHELVQWFSNPALAHAHLDYPTLVPSLHSATYDSIGHVDEFVTKFWPTWMLLFLLAALASAIRIGNGWFNAAPFALLGLLLLPATQQYVQWEGSTMPMIFFTIMGFMQCAIYLAGKDRARLGLGLTLLLGAAMTKFEGSIFLALVGGWILLLPSARPSLKLSPRLWLAVAFCFLAALPFVCLRFQIPTLNYESSSVGDVLHHPATLFSTLSDLPRLLLIEFARLFVNPDFANWNGEGGQLHWIGKWAGLSSLYNPSTLGVAWLCLLMTIALWFSVPSRRQVIAWTLAMFVGATLALCAVFTTFVSIHSLSDVIGYTNDGAGGRYLLPVLLAWFTTMTMLFSETERAVQKPATATTRIVEKKRKRR
jgi:hypothetical protein